MSSKSKGKSKIPEIIVGIVLIIVAVEVMIAIIMAIQLYKENNSGEDSFSTEESRDTEVWQEGTITYNGKKYAYNDTISTYLIMGIDKDSDEEAVDGYDGGQSDALFLLVSDKKKEKVTLISINRNTMTDIEVYDENGTYVGTGEGQICLQHGYGDGGELSCERTCQAVSKLFYNLPVTNYFAFTMDAMPVMNDAVGGVEVEILEDISRPSDGVELKKGEVRKLNGTEAYYYLRSRDTSQFDSATMRLRRQEQYMAAFMAQIDELAENDLFGLVGLYDAVSSYSVTNIDVTELVYHVSGYERSEEVLTLPGEARMGEVYEEYYVDKAAFYDMIIQVFYEEISQS